MQRTNQALPEPLEIDTNYNYILEHFWDIQNLRSSNGYSLNPVSWLEVEAWQRGTGNLLTNDEAKIIMGLFRVFDEAYKDIQTKDED